MAKKNTFQIRIITEGKFDKLLELLRNQFKKKHSFTPGDKELCEVIAKGVEDAKVF